MSRRWTEDRISRQPRRSSPAGMCGELQRGTPTWLSLGREPKVEIVRDSLGRGRVDVRQHRHHVSGRGVDPQVPVHAGCDASVADPDVSVGPASIFEPVGVSGAGGQARVGFPVIRSLVVSGLRSLWLSSAWPNRA